jgi:hypothetical protein
VLLMGCGGRPSAWDSQYQPASVSQGLAPAYGLTGAVAVVDSSLERLTVLHSPSPLTLAAQSIPLGKDLATAQTSFDRKTLFVLSRGVQPQRNPDDEPPKLLLIDGSTTPKVERSYTLTEPMDQLALDPKNEWAALYGGSGVVVNPNELELVDLSGTGSAAITPKTLRSFGGKPNRFTFTAPLAVPGGDPKRFLIVERDSDLVLIDLANPSASEVTVPLPNTDVGGSATSAQVVYDADSATIGVRVTGTTSVFLLQLAPRPRKPAKTFRWSPIWWTLAGCRRPSTSCTTRKGCGWWRSSARAQCWSTRSLRSLRPRRCRSRSPAFVASRTS